MQCGTRAVLIISVDLDRWYSPTVIVAVITSRACSKVILPTPTKLLDFKGLDKESVILLEQIRTLDKQRLTKYMGMLPCSTMARVDKALAISISLSIPPEEKCVKRQKTV